MRHHKDLSARRLRLALPLVLGAALWSAACSSPDDPREVLAKRYAGQPEYSVILEDMDTSGTFFKTRHHRYKVVTAEPDPAGGDTRYNTQLTDWMPVPKKLHGQMAPLLGMTILAKTAEGLTRTPYPPGYNLVGNSRCGRWVTDAKGEELWDFYPRCRSTWGTAYPIYRSDYTSYRSARQSSRPYFGRDKSGRDLYGTRGASTQTTHRSFFDRQQARQASKRSGFSQKVKSRSSSRSRSGFSFGGK